MFVFYPREPVQTGDRPFRFRHCHQAVKKRDELIARGLSPSPVWEYRLDPCRALRCCDPFDRACERYTVRQVLARLNRVLKREGLEGQLDYGFSPNHDYGEDRGWPDTMKWVNVLCDYRHIACYAAVGHNEGHYIHIEALGWDGRNSKRLLISLGKTFSGQEVALRIAARCTQLLGA